MDPKGKVPTWGSLESQRFVGLGFRVYRAYLDPTEPTFLGLLIMISLYKSLER